MLNLENKVVIVTGAARGIGKAVCEALVEAGCFVVATDVLEEVLMTTARDLGNKVSAHVHDVSGESQWQSIVIDKEHNIISPNGFLECAGFDLFSEIATNVGALTEYSSITTDNNLAVVRGSNVNGYANPDLTFIHHLPRLLYR